MIDFAALAAHFPPGEVSWRLGSVSKPKKRGMALAYLDARNVMDRLDDVCGPDGWQCTYPHAHTKTVCSVGIWCGEERGWVWKTNGAGDSDIEAEKGAMSDAFKRAAVLWGIGRYLYTLASPWVEVEEIGQTGKFKFADSAQKELNMVLYRAAQPRDAAPAPKPSPPAQSSAHGQQLAADDSHLVDKDRNKGEAPGAPTEATRMAARAAKIKDATDKRIKALTSKTWTAAELDDFTRENLDWIEWMRDPENKATADYNRFKKAHDGAMPRSTLEAA
jgi:hypothetical protein